MQEYNLNYGCYRGGIYRDGRDMTIKAASDEDAVSQASDELHSLRRYYDRIDYRLKQGDRLVSGNC